MNINTDNIKYIGGRNKCRDEELDRKIWDNIPHGKIYVDGKQYHSQNGKEQES
jgi:hypothetical protein